jgi:hypothetical protein
MTRIELQTRILALRQELDTRYKYGTVKIANADGSPVPVEILQNEMFSLIYKLSKVLNQDNE